MLLSRGLFVSSSEYIIHFRYPTKRQFRITFGACMGAFSCHDGVWNHFYFDEHYFIHLIKFVFDVARLYKYESYKNTFVASMKGGIAASNNRLLICGKTFPTLSYAAILNSE